MRPPPRAVAARSTRPNLAALPPATLPASVVLVRHGQSTWNAEGRVQGSSDASVLTERGRAQAAAARDALATISFGAMIHSPLARAAETAAIVWGDRPGAVLATPSLREIDLHSLQGTLKTDAPAVLGAAAHAAWRGAPADFELDGHRPVVDLWARAAAAWGEILEAGAATTPPLTRRRLVVAHNAVNQALIATALGLPPATFRRVVQSNACATEVVWRGEGDTPTATVTCLNVGPAAPPLAPAPRGGGLILMIAADSEADAERGVAALAGGARGAAAVVATEDVAAGAAAAVLSAAGLPQAVTVSVPDVLATAAAAAAGGRGAAVVVVAPPAAVAAALAATVGVMMDGTTTPPPFTITGGSVSVVEVPPGDGAAARAALRCANWLPGGVAAVVGRVHVQ